MYVRTYVRTYVHTYVRTHACYIHVCMYIHTCMHACNMHRDQSSAYCVASSPTTFIINTETLSSVFILLWATVSTVLCVNQCFNFSQQEMIL